MCRILSLRTLLITLIASLIVGNANATIPFVPVAPQQIREAISTGILRLVGPDSQEIEFTNLTVTPSNGTTSVQASSRGDSVSITFDGRHAFGYLHTDGKSYVLDTVDGLIRLYDEAAYPGSEIYRTQIDQDDAIVGPSNPGGSQSANPDAPERLEQNSSGTVMPTIVDIAFFYDQEFESEAGLACPRTKAESAVAFTNSVYQTHEIPLELRAVYVGPMPVPSAGDPFRQFVFDSGSSAIAATYGADLVHRIFRYSPELGIPYCGQAFMPGRYGVSGVGCGSTDIVIAHEVGHNFGLNHDRAVARGQTFLHGLNDRNYGFGCGGSGTIMAYITPRLPIYSSPLQVSNGEPCGIPAGLPNAADNADVLSIQRVAVADFSPPQTTSGEVELIAMQGTDVSEEDSPILGFEIVRTGDLTDTVSVEIGTRDISTEVQRDYQELVERIEFLSGEESKTVSLEILDDDEFEGDVEQLEVVLRYPQGVAITGTPQIVAISSTDSDRGEASTGGFTATTESVGTFGIPVFRHRTTDGQLRIQYTTEDGTAIDGVDYVGTSGTLVFEPGEDVKFVEVQILDDQDFDGYLAGVYFTLRLEGDNVGAPEEGLVNIVNDDLQNGVVSFAESAISIAEDGRAAIMTIDRTGGTEGPLSFALRTRAGTAVADQDFLPAEATLVLEDGITGTRASVAILDNLRFDGDRSFFVDLLDSDGLAVDSLEVTITNDDEDSGLARFAENSISVPEDASSVSIVVRRDGSANGDLQVSFTTLDGSARAGENYVGQSGSITFGDGQTEASIDIAILDNQQTDRGLTFRIQLVGQLLADPSIATISIVDNDTQSSNAVASRSSTPVAQPASSGGGAISPVWALLCLLVCLHRRVTFLSSKRLLVATAVVLGFSAPAFGQRVTSGVEVVEAVSQITVVQEPGSQSITPDLVRVFLTDVPINLPKYDQENTSLLRATTSVDVSIDATATCASIPSVATIDPNAPPGTVAGCWVRYVNSPSEFFGRLEWENPEGNPGISINADRVFPEIAVDNFSSTNSAITIMPVGSGRNRSAIGGPLLDEFWVKGVDDPGLLRTDADLELVFSVDAWLIYPDGRTRPLSVGSNIDFSSFLLTLNYEYVWEPSQDDFDPDELNTISKELISGIAPPLSTYMYNRRPSTFGQVPLGLFDSPVTLVTKNGFNEDGQTVLSRVVVDSNTALQYGRSPIATPVDWTESLRMYVDSSCQWLLPEFGGTREPSLPEVSIRFSETLSAFQISNSSCAFGANWYWLPPWSPDRLFTDLFVLSAGEIARLREAWRNIQDVIELGTSIESAYNSFSTLLTTENTYRRVFDAEVSSPVTNVVQSTTSFEIQATERQAGFYIRAELSYAAASAFAALGVSAGSVSFGGGAVVGGVFSIGALYASKQDWDRARMSWSGGSAGAQSQPAIGRQLDSFGRISVADLRPSIPAVEQISDTRLRQSTEVFLDYLTYLRAAYLSLDAYDESVLADDADGAARASGDAIAFMEQAARSIELVGAGGGLLAIGSRASGDGATVRESLMTNGFPESWRDEIAPALGITPTELEEFRMTLLDNLDDAQFDQLAPIDSAPTFELLGMSLRDTANDFRMNTVNLPLPLVSVPNFLGMQDSEALSLLGSLGFGLGTVIQAADRTVPAGIVMAQNIFPGERVPNATFVSFTVSSGLPIVGIPDLAGLTEAGASASITASNLALGLITTESSSTVPAGEVIRQSPAPGVRVQEQTEVSFWVSSGPAPGGGGSGGSGSGGGGNSGGQGGSSSAGGGGAASLLLLIMAAAMRRRVREAWRRTEGRSPY